MKAQTPAEGILLHRDYGDMKFYTVTCECGCDEHSHQICVEADEGGVSVQTFVELKTDFWTQAVEPKYDIDNDMLQWYNWFWTGLWNSLCTRLRLTKEIWFNGYAKYEGTICMNRQQATNYAETLINAVADVTEFRKKM